jgi:hypothetical protein
MPLHHPETPASVILLPSLPRQKETTKSQPCVLLLPRPERMRIVSPRYARPKLLLLGQDPYSVVNSMSVSLSPTLHIHPISQNSFALLQELGKTTTATAPVLPKKSPEEIKALLPNIVNESDIVKQALQWSELKESKSLTAFGKANLRTFPVSLAMLESRAGVSSTSLGLDESEVSLDDFKMATLYVLGGSTVAGIASLALLPPNIGATLCYVFALLPILFLSVGSSAPGYIANAISSVRGDVDDGVTPQERICRHEAAHFCCGYWCGLPIKGYSVENGIAKVEFGVNTQQLTATEVAALSVTALSGLVAEAQTFGKAVGAESDLLTLEMVFRQSADFIGAAAQQDLTRWGALNAALLLKEHNAKYEQVVQAFASQQSVEDCVAILES